MLKTLVEHSFIEILNELNKLLWYSELKHKFQSNLKKNYKAAYELTAIFSFILCFFFSNLKINTFLMCLIYSSLTLIIYSDKCEGDSAKKHDDMSFYLHVGQIKHGMLRDQ